MAPPVPVSGFPWNISVGVSVGTSPGSAPKTNDGASEGVSTVLKLNTLVGGSEGLSSCRIRQASSSTC